YDIRAGVDDQGIGPGRNDRTVVDERHLPAPRWPAPEIVLSTLGRVALGTGPEMKFSALSDRSNCPPAWSVMPWWMSCRCVSFPIESTAIIPELLTKPLSGSTAPSLMVIVPALFATGV